jgi:hypothetical protein
VNLIFEFLTVFRRKTGLERLAVKLSHGVESRPTVLDALTALQTECRELKLLHRKRLVAGVLVFRRSSAGGLERVVAPEQQGVSDGEILVLSTAMEGG